MRRSFVFATTAAIAASLSTTLLAGTALAQAAAIRQQVIPEGQGASPTHTPGIRVGNMLFASGQLGMSRTAPDTTIQGQTRLALESTKKVFEAAGTTLAVAVKADGQLSYEALLRQGGRSDAVIHEGQCGFSSDDVAAHHLQVAEARLHQLHRKTLGRCGGLVQHHRRPRPKDPLLLGNRLMAHGIQRGIVLHQRFKASATPPP